MMCRFCFCRSSSLGQFALAASTFGHYLSLLHPSFFHFILGISSLLALLALYETKKLHYYRRQVVSIFRTLLALFSAFYLFRLSIFLNLASSSGAQIYIYFTIFTLITAFTNKLHLRIIIDVNELR